MKNIIRYTQKDFEAVVPVAASKNDNLFNSLMPEFLSSEKKFIELLIGEDFWEEQVVNFDTNAEDVKKDDISKRLHFVDTLKKCVMINAFVNNIRTLDVVLTDVGFGVVSTQDIAPASQQRVDMVEEEYMQKYARLLDRLARRAVCIDPEWVRSVGCDRLAPSFFSFDDLETLGFSLSSKNWSRVQPFIMRADRAARALLGNAFIEELRRCRLAKKNSDINYRAVEEVRSYMTALITSGFKSTHPERACLEFFDANADDYPTYKNSPQYKARHGEPFENKKDSSAYFFNG